MNLFKFTKCFQKDMNVSTLWHHFLIQKRYLIIIIAGLLVTVYAFFATVEYNVKKLDNKNFSSIEKNIKRWSHNNRLNAL